MVYSTVPLTPLLPTLHCPQMSSLHPNVRGVEKEKEEEKENKDK